MAPNAGVPTSILLAARNYQTEAEAAILIPWSPATVGVLIEWKQLFATLKAQAPDLRSIDVEGCFSAYDTADSCGPIMNWIADHGVGEDDFYDDPVCLHSKEAPIHEWEPVRVRVPRMVISKNSVYFTFVEHHGVGTYESGCIVFDDKNLFGPDAA